MVFEGWYVGGGWNGFGGYPVFMTPAEERLTEYSEDGVDLTLIRWMLSLTPAERLEFLEQQINCILEIQELNGRT
jgi:hypothetical protein